MVLRGLGCFGRSKRSEEFLWEQVDVWALGISAIEMAEVTPPRWVVHPMRVIFMISREPPPQLADKDGWSPAFQDFVASTLRKVRFLPQTWHVPLASSSLHQSTANMHYQRGHQCLA